MFIGQTQANTTYTFIQKHIHKHLYNVYTNMYIHHTLSFMHKEEQYIVNNKHVEQERSLTEYDNYKYSRFNMYRKDAFLTLI